MASLNAIIAEIIEKSKNHTSLPSQKFQRKYPPQKHKSSDAKIFLIGTGGIGCELLKNLLTSGFRDIEIIDLDTIELSNLNRQFLFRQTDIGQPKSMIAKTRANAFAPGAKITAHHNNVKTAAFGLPFFSKFDLVINALDNLSTRRHVNRICVAKNKLLLESGTQGYSGQVYLIDSGKTECYECVEKMAPKTYPVCTIRDTPSLPVHCVAWAKMMYDSVFGPDELVNDLSDLKIKKSDTETTLQFAERLFDTLFCENIKTRLSMKHTATNTKNDPNTENQPDIKPTLKPIFLSDLKLKLSQDIANIFSDISSRKDLINAPLSAKNLAIVFLQSVEKSLSEKKSLFDKDDESAMDFVSAAANLRMLNYSIPTISRFEAMGIAGNIIHAIATTNAVCAGLIALDAENILLNAKKHLCQRRWIQLNHPGPKIIIPETPSAPNPHCIVCSEFPMDLVCNVRSFTVRELFERVLKTELGMVAPVVDVAYGESTNFITEELAEWDGNRQWMDDYFARPLAHEAVKIAHGSLLSVDDDRQAFRAKIVVVHCKDIKNDEKPFTLKRKKDHSVDHHNSDNNGKMSKSSPEPEKRANSGKKRKRGETAEVSAETGNKKEKVVTISD